MKVILCKNKNWWAIIAKLISFFQPLTRCSHCVIKDPSGVYVDISFGGYREYSEDEFLKNYEQKFSFKYPGKSAIETARKYKSKGYGVMQLIGSLMIVLFKMKNPFKNKDTLLICNEFVLLVLKDLGLIKYSGDIEDLDIDMMYKILNKEVSNDIHKVH